MERSALCKGRLGFSRAPPSSSSKPRRGVPAHRPLNRGSPQPASPRPASPRRLALSGSRRRDSQDRAPVACAVAEHAGEPLAARAVRSASHARARFRHLGVQGTRRPDGHGRRHRALARKTGRFGAGNRLAAGHCMWARPGQESRVDAQAGTERRRRGRIRLRSHSRCTVRCGARQPCRQFRHGSLPPGNPSGGARMHSSSRSRTGCSADRHRSPTQGAVRHRNLPQAAIECTLIS